jgi:hypothetical protein
VGDDFEDPQWGFIHHHPKSSREQDERVRFPMGASTNQRWFEGPERGQPDEMQVVPTPASGLPGSNLALRVRTLNSGIPGRISRAVEQDDLIVSSMNRIGAIPVSETPNVVVRVYLPPANEWEQRSGPHFGFRVTTTTTVRSTQSQGRFGRSSQSFNKMEQYWPGIWIHFRRQSEPQVDQASAFLTVRGNRLGRDFPVRDIPQQEFGWWTLGMSVTPDGGVHYYASPGVDDLTANDLLTSQFPYSYRAQRFETMFFDICNANDGKTWSTAFVIDDPQLFLVDARRVQAIVAQKRQLEQQRVARQGTRNR